MRDNSRNNNLQKLQTAIKKTKKDILIAILKEV